MSNSELQVTVTADSTELSSGLQQGEEAVKRFADQGKNQVKELRKEIKQLSKDASSIGKMSGMIGNFGVGGLLGSAIGGPLGGFIGHAMQDAVKSLAPDLEKWIDPMVAAKDLGTAWGELKAACKGVSAETQAWNDEIANSKEKLGPLLTDWKKQEDEISIQIALLRDGKEEADRYAMALRGVPKNLQEQHQQQQKILENLKEQAAAEQAATQKREQKNVALDQLSFQASSADLDPITKKAAEMRRQFGLSDEEVKRVIADLTKMSEVQQKIRDQQEAKQIMSQVDPMRGLTDHLSEINRLQQRGALSQDEAQQAGMHAISKAFPDKAEIGSVGAATKGSVEASQAVINAQKQANLQAQQLEQQKQATQILQAIQQALQGPPDVAQARM